MNQLPFPIIKSVSQLIFFLIVTGYAHAAQANSEYSLGEEECKKLSLELEDSPTVLPIAKKYFDNACKDLLVFSDWTSTKMEEALAEIENGHNPLEEFMRNPKKNRTREELLYIKKYISQSQESSKRAMLEYKQMIEFITKSLIKLIAVVGTQVTYCEQELKEAGIWVDEFNLFSSSGEKIIEQSGVVSEDDLQNTYSLASMATTYQLKEKPATYCSLWVKADASNSINQLSFLSMLQNIK
jgi:hypothetical protein